MRAASSPAAKRVKAKCVAAVIAAAMNFMMNSHHPHAWTTPVGVRTAADDAPATWVAPSVSSFSGQPKFVRLREDIEEEGIPRQRVPNNPDSPIKEMLAPRGSFSKELTTYLQWAGVVALFVLLVVFLATGTPPGAPDGALAD